MVARPLPTLAAATSLARLLELDIQPQGDHMLLPFLDTHDLLRLSGCCQGLLSYRYHLLRIELRMYPSLTRAVECMKGLMSSQEGKWLPACAGQVQAGAVGGAGWHGVPRVAPDAGTGETG
jgi:hypothetical protein